MVDTPGGEYAVIVSTMNTAPVVGGREVQSTVVDIAPDRTGSRGGPGPPDHGRGAGWTAVGTPTGVMLGQSTLHGGYGQALLIDPVTGTQSPVGSATRAVPAGHLPDGARAADVPRGGVGVVAVERLRPLRPGKRTGVRSRLDGRRLLVEHVRGASGTLGGRSARGDRPAPRRGLADQDEPARGPGARRRHGIRRARPGQRGDRRSDDVRFRGSAGAAAGFGPAVHPRPPRPGGTWHRARSYSTCGNGPGAA
ncbi:hypothetical protein ACU686_26360 [Yinghuangia aomiensis]